jgi:hypothetical protein
MEATTERDLPLPVRNKMRQIDLDAIEGRISEAERDMLIDALLESLRIPLPEADD